MPNPAGGYYCDIRTDKPTDLHYAAEGMRVCDVFRRGEIEEAASDDEVSPEIWIHTHVRKAEDVAWQIGYDQGLAAGQNGDLLGRLLRRLETVDDDEIGLMLAELKAGVGKG